MLAEIAVKNILLQLSKRGQEKELYRELQKQIVDKVYEIDGNADKVLTYMETCKFPQGTLSLSAHYVSQR